LGSSNFTWHLIDFCQYLLNGNYCELAILLLHQIDLCSDTSLLGFKLGFPFSILILLLLGLFINDCVGNLSFHLLSMSQSNLISFDLHSQFQVHLSLLLFLNHLFKSFDFFMQAFNLLIGFLDAHEFFKTIFLSISSFFGLIFLNFLDTSEITSTVSIVKLISFDYSCVVTFELVFVYCSWIIIVLSSDLMLSSIGAEFHGVISIKVT